MIFNYNKSVISKLIEHKNPFLDVPFHQAPHDLFNCFCFFSLAEFYVTHMKTFIFPIPTKALKKRIFLEQTQCFFIFVSHTKNFFFI